MKSIADIIADTREYIESHGWWRGALKGPNGRQVCTLGGIYHSQGWNGRTEHQEHQTETDAINRYINQALMGMHSEGFLTDVLGRRDHKIGNLTITDWNDHYALDKQDVLDTLAKAEKIARAGFDPDA